MKITVFGANGKIGQHFVEKALQNGDQVTAYVRRASSLTLQHPKLEIVVGNLTDEQQMTAAIEGQDAVVSTLGAPLSVSRKVQSLPISEGHAMIIKIMEQTGVKRFITLATPTIVAAEDKKQVITVMPGMMAKLLFPTGHAEMIAIGRLLAQSKVDWTVVRIANPNTNNDGNGYAISFGDTKAKFTVSRKNVAYCMHEALRNDQWIGKMPIVFNK